LTVQAAILRFHLCSRRRRAPWTSGTSPICLLFSIASCLLNQL
jgi:hypothetical protein